jgi:hypothetical protein
MSAPADILKGPPPMLPAHKFAHEYFEQRTDCTPEGKP